MTNELIKRIKDPDKALFLYAYVRKEAVLSSQIEGTQSSLSDLLLFELEGLDVGTFVELVVVEGRLRRRGHGEQRDQTEHSHDSHEGSPPCGRESSRPRPPLGYAQRQGSF